MAMMKKILNRIRDQLLNTPEKQWIVVFGYHLHKSFWGTLAVVVGAVWHFWPAILMEVGLIALSIAGHIYTHNKPYFKLWDKYQK